MAAAREQKTRALPVARLLGLIAVMAFFHTYPRVLTVVRPYDYRRRICLSSVFLSGAYSDKTETCRRWKKRYVI